jgi:type IV secretory pathway VirB6-like protein
MDILSTISQSCDSLTASPASAAIATSGHGLALGLGLCVIVYEGVNVSLNAHRGHRIDLMRLGRSLLGVLVVIALVQFYDTPNWILGGYSFKNLIGAETTYLTNAFGSTAVDNVMTTVDQDLTLFDTGSGISLLTQPIVFFALMIYVGMFTLLEIALTWVIAYGAIATTVVGLFGPLFIPFLLVPKLEWLFWGWFRAYLGFAFYKVVAAAVASVVASVLVNYLSPGSQFYQQMQDPTQLWAALPIVAVVLVTCIFAVFKVPAITASIFSGTVGSDANVMGAATSAATSAAALI